MRLMKSHPMLQFINGLVMDLPAPANISYLWNYGSLLALTLVMQMMTGMFLAMHYTPHMDLAFISLEHIMSDVNYGWLLSYLHANGASMFFIVVYMHMASGLYYGSYTKPRMLLWSMGVMMFMIMMATAFMGYVLPWGQMSFWGATVITNMLSAMPYVGNDMVQWVWGGFAVDNPTLNSFFSLHYLLPFMMTALAFLHMLALHDQGSNNPLGMNSDMDKMPFHPYFTTKDLLGMMLFFMVFASFVFFAPNMLGHSDNYIPANPLVTPPHMVPEWYFLFPYAILSSMPNKLAGVMALFGSLLMLFALPLLHTSYLSSSTFSPIYKKFYWFFIMNFMMLTWMGGNPVEDPYILMGQMATMNYFSYFMIMTPLMGWLENKLMLNTQMNVTQKFNLKNYLSNKKNNTP